MVVYTLEQHWAILRQIDIQKMPILARWSSFWSWRHLGHRKPTRIHWKADVPETSYCLVRILVQRHNWGIFLRKWARRGRYSQWRSLLGQVERIFVHKNWREGYWQHLVSTGRRYVPHSRSFTRCFVPCFWRSYYQPQSWCRLAALELRFDIVGLLLVGCRQRYVLRLQVRDNWRLKGQHSWSHCWNTAAHKR